MLRTYNLLARRLGGLWRSDLYTQREDRPNRFKSLIVPRRSVYLRHLDCGSCNGCELELNALENPVYDIARLGYEFKASPRQADVLVMTGPFTRNLAEAAQHTLEAMPPAPHLVTVGDCAADGGIFKESYALVEWPAGIRAAFARSGELHVEGCPPTPEDLIAALDRLTPPDTIFARVLRRARRILEQVVGLAL